MFQLDAYWYLYLSRYRILNSSPIVAAIIV